MRDFNKMSIDQLQEVLSKVTDPTSASPTEAILQSKSILFLSSEIATFKEALSNNASALNGTLGITNKSIEELRGSINESTEKLISSNKKLADSQTINSWVMTALTSALVIVGVLQVVVMNRQVEIMKLQADDQVKDSNESKVSRSVDYAGIYDQQLNSGKNHEISIALEKGKPLLKEAGGTFLTSDVDAYLGLYNKLDEVFDAELITGELVYSNFSDDLIRAYKNKEIQNYLKKRRLEDDDNYRGFDDLAEYCLKVFKERKS